MALGQAALMMAAHWLQGEETYDDGEGGEIIVPNLQFADPELVALLDASEAQDPRPPQTKAPKVRAIRPEQGRVGAVFG